MRECRECRDWPAAVVALRWAWVMAPPADALVHALKYQGWSALAREMGLDMARALRSAPGPPPDLVTPVPTTEARRAQRGYNQAALLAKTVAEEVGRPLRHTLRRTHDGPTQVALPPSLRRANVEGAFAASPLNDRVIRGRHVILVDDVLTTGATAAQAAGVLRAGGAARVTVLTYARALPGPGLPHG